MLEADGLCLLIDCGLYQERSLLNRNWENFPVLPEKIDYILLTHSHLDHVGLLPKLIQKGFSGTIVTTPATKDLMKIVLYDSARLLKEDALYKKKRHKKEGRRGPYPEIPLYTGNDVKRVFPLVKSIGYNSRFSFDSHLSVTLHDAGHILGSAIVEIHDKGNNRKILFSGDLGQWNKPLVKDPSVFRQADYIVMESTYGDHDHESLQEVSRQLSRIINETLAAGGNLVIPTFAIERTQELMYHLSRLVRENKIPFVKIFLDSPMAIDVTEIFQKYKTYLDRETLQLFQEEESPFRFPGLQLMRSKEQSKRINAIKEPCIIMAGSGMCTGGRIKHHLIRNISRPQSTVLFVGFQARGTLGRLIVSGQKQVRIHGSLYDVNARIEKISGFSAHADRKALLKWLGFFQKKPKGLFLVHGEEQAASSLAEAVRSSYRWDVSQPHYLEEWELE